MKITTSLVLVLAGFVAITQTFKDAPKQIEEQIPRVSITGGGIAQTDSTRFCPRVTFSPEDSADSSVYTYEDADGHTHSTRHCVKCHAGVYVTRDEREGKYCSFCGEKE
jgi:hypothetical protein